MKYLFLLVFTALLFSCFQKHPPDYIQKKVWGWKANYGADTMYKKMTYSDTAVKMTNPGKIYVKGNIIYQSDLGKGIHIINNSNPATAKRIAFIGLPGNSDLSVKGNLMYANNYDDIVVIDLNNYAAPVEVNRLKNKFFTTDSNKPLIWVMPPEPGPAACLNYYQDSVIIGWVRDSVYACYSF